MMSCIFLLLSSCDSRIKRSKRSKFYAMLINRDWAVLNVPDYDCLNSKTFQDSTLKFMRLAVLIDSAKVAEKRQSLNKNDRVNFMASIRTQV